MKDDIVLSAQGIVTRFGDKTVHDGISLDVRRGEILGIAGDSGSGKSLLLKTMAGLRKPNAGNVTIDGRPIEKIPPAETASMLGMLFQEGALFSSLNVAQNIMLPLREYTALPEDQQADIAQLKLALAKMPPDSSAKYPSELSGGMTKRAALARALAMDPLILFLDEPTSSLDPVNASSFDQLILDLNHGLQVTVVMVTHDLNSLFTICDRAAILVDKQIVTDTLPRLLHNTHPWIQEFLHGPRGQGAAAAARKNNSQNNQTDNGGAHGER